jgi:3-oxoacyl-[acyl-carrier-protein] synthase-1
MGFGGSRLKMGPIPITGYSAVHALGGTREEIVAALRAGRSGLEAPRLDLPFPTLVGTVETPLPELPAKLADWSTRQARLVAYLIHGLDAELSRLRNRVPPERIGVFLGTSTAGAATTEIAYRHYQRHRAWPDGFHFQRQHPFGAVLDVVRAMTGAAGPGWIVSTACSSSAKTLGSARRLIEEGTIDAAITGGVDTLCEMTLFGFASLGALSAERCRPFSSEAAGINIGEGGALVLLERDGEPRALLEGVGESSDAYHISAPHPEGAGARLAMERALPEGCRPEDIDHVNAHGTGTLHNDTAESEAIRQVLGAGVPVVSTKGYTGHTLGGSGATEIALSITLMEEGFIPMSLGAEPLHPELGINVVCSSTSAKLRRVMSNSFAFGGNNITVTLRAP